MATKQVDRRDDRIDVSLALNEGARAEFESPRTSARQELRGLLCDLVSDLGLKSEPQITITPLAPGDRRSLSLTLNGAKCPLRSALLMESRSALAVARRIVESVYANMDNVVSSRVASEVATRLSGEGPTVLKGLRAEDVRSLLQMLAQRSFSVRRAVDWARDRTPSNPLAGSVEALRDEMLPRLGVLRIAASVCPQHYRALTTDAGCQMLQNLGHGFFYETGIPLPSLDLRPDEALRDGEYRLQFNDLRLATQQGLCMDEFLVADDAQTLAGAGLPARPKRFPADRRMCAVLESDAAARWEEAGHVVWDAVGHLVLSIAAAARERRGHLVSAALVDVMLTHLEQGFPSLIGALRARLSLTLFAGIVQRLADEYLPVRDLRGIAEAVLSVRSTLMVKTENWPIVAPPSTCLVGREKGVDQLGVGDYVEHIRRRFQARIGQMYAPDGRLRALALSQDGKEMLRSCDGHLDAGAREDLSTALDEVVLNGEPIPAILVPFGSRGTFHQIVRRTHPFMPVLSHLDLAPGIQVEEIGAILWP